MRVLAPGKLLLAGAYAVLDGAPALVVAVDRHAVADGSRRAESPTPEVLAALPADDAPDVDASPLREGAHKLGLGSSAAMLVASIGVSYARAGRDLGRHDVRDAIFADARRAHAQVQGGGSGVVVAASVYGGALAYTLAPTGTARVEPVHLPDPLVVDVFWYGAPATTMGMRGLVDALRQRDARAYGARIAAIGGASAAAIAAGQWNDAPAFLAAARAGAEALAALGRDADAPIVPASIAGLLPLAGSDGAAFLPSGAGGGDVFIHLAVRAASAQFHAAAVAAGMRFLPMSLEPEGVRLVP